MGIFGLIRFDMPLIEKYVGETPSVFATVLLRQRRNCCVEAAIYGYIWFDSFCYAVDSEIRR